MSINNSILIITAVAAAAALCTTANALRVPDNVKRAEQSSTKAESNRTTTSITKTIVKSTITGTKTTTKAAATSSAHLSTTVTVEELSSSKSASTAKTLEIHATSVIGIGTSALPASSISPTLLSSASASTQLPSGSSSTSTGGIVGGIIAAVVVVALGAAAFLVVHKRKRSRQRTKAHLSSKADPFTMGFSNNDHPYNNHFPAQQQPAQHQSPYQQHQTTFDNYEVAAISPENQAAIQQQQQLPIAAAAIANTANAPSLGIFTVIATYIPTLSDELEIDPGDQIELFVEYDDGWCQGVNISKGYAKGVFPRHCIDYATALSNYSPNPEFERSKRVSSMYQNK
ncbi:hypothetical protein [Parasitella parasitica]|uniref:SH3 domain-containing protein n=1 Tax=Parasitella parasitica TaxID=35722 RepID=A0A0B7N1M2_9FUNG|nr:hypothetical protein [Parasitella parasitica]